MKIIRCVWTLALVLAWDGGGRALAQGSAFTYQGRLQDAGEPATGWYELRFVLRDALSGGSQVPGTPTLATGVGVTNGQFTVLLDFGGAAFNGAARWLEIGVRPNGSLSAYTVLAPRQPVTPSPYATMAGAAGSYTGAISDNQLSATVARLNAAQTVSGLTTFAPAGGAPFGVSSTNRVNNLNADLVDGLSAGAFWNVGGNAGLGAANFMGTLDNQALQLRVNSSPALRLVPNATSPNLVGGHAGNFVSGAAFGASIGGGGAVGATNEVTAAHGTVAGGRGNRVAGLSGNVGGGDGNQVFGGYGVVGGGFSNQAATVYATVGGGATNVASGAGAVVGGGTSNVASGLRATASGGSGNTAANAYATVSGGFLNAARGLGSTVAGGVGNVASASYATVGGGNGNTAAGLYSFAAGQAAGAAHDGSFVWADSSSPFGFSSTGPNQFLIRATGGVGIGAPPEDAQLDVEGDARINDYDLLLRSGLDRNHGLGWYGSGKPFAGVNPDGPVLYGWEGGALGSVQGADRIALRWTVDGNVGIGTPFPAARLHVADTVQNVGLFESSQPGGSWLSLDNTGGGRRWSFISTGTANGEGPGQLLFFAGGAGGTKVTFRDNGNVGIGTVFPGDRLEIFGPDATLRIRNQNDGIGGFVGDTFGSVQLGLFNPGGTAVGAVPAGAKRSFFGLDAQGRVGSLVSNFGNPAFRNLLDDGSGNMSVTSGGSLGFGASTRQMLNLWSVNYGVGVQNNTLYFRTDGNVAWYRLGSHSDTTYDPGAGGTVLMRLDNGGLTVNGTFISSSDRARKENIGSVDPRDVLARLVAVPVHKWNYKDDAGVRHIGPMAQDFHAAFGVGPDEKHIAMVDADGVALAAIQGLHALVQEKEARIAALEARLAALETVIGNR